MEGQGIHSDRADRRAADRASITREVLFSGDHERGPLHEARARDISAEGLQLLTARPVMTGAHLQLELHPAAGFGKGSPLFLSGVVVYCKSAGTREYRVGVRFTSRIDVPRQDLGALFLDAAGRSQGEVPVRFEEAQESRERRNRWWLLLAAVVLLAAALGLLASVALRNRDAEPLPSANGPAAPPDLFATLSGLPNRAYDTAMSLSGNRPPSILSGVEPRMLNLVEALRPLFPEDVPEDTTDRGYALLIEGNVAEARDLFERIAGQPNLSDLERFRVKLGIAQSLAILDSRNTALSLAVELMAESTPAIPQPWQDAAKRLHETLTRGRVDIDALLLSTELHFGSQSLMDADPAPPALGVYVDIDKSDYVLTVYRDGKPVQTYPIGIGADDATPEGRFTVANKIEFPTWFNKGNPVPHGDPRNPLGDHWLGLGTNGVATTYGIHATPELGSVGTATSAGCIRMRPGDASAIFAACDVGTPVYIRP